MSIDRIHVFTSFSLGRNIRQLFAADENPDSMHCIYGLRVLALTWIILGHRLYFAMFVPMTSFKGVLNVSFGTESTYSQTNKF